MSDAQDGRGGPEPVGSVGEEAAKLFGALSDWARHQDPLADAGSNPDDDPVAEAVKNVGEHVATGREDCRHCPVCQVLQVARRTSPEVRAHLAAAASSLVQAAAGLLATQAQERQQPSSVEKIDLDPGSGWDEEP